MLLYGQPFGREVGEVAQREVSRAEVQCRRYAKLEEFAEAELAQHAYGEAHVPAVLVGNDGLLHHAAFLGLYQVRTHIAEVDVLCMGAYNHAEVERAQVGVGTVLHTSLLCMSPRQADTQYIYKGE